MTNAEKVMILKVRRKVLRGRGDKNLEQPGVLKKIDRQIAKLSV